MPAGAQSQKRSTWNTSLADAEARKEGIEHRFGARRAGDPIERGARATKAFGNDQRIGIADDPCRSGEHTSDIQSLMRITYAVFCLTNKKKNRNVTQKNNITKIIK